MAPDLPSPQVLDLLAALRAGPSRRCGRAMDWPRPAILKGVTGVEAAERQGAVGYVADRHFDPVRLRLSVDWTLNPFRDKAWIMRFMCLQPADAYFYAFDETGEEHWLRKACEIVLDWSRFHITGGRRAYMSWIDMACGYRAIKISRLLDRLVEGGLPVDEDEARLLVEAALAHVAELTNPATLSHGNHGIFQMHGLAMLATMLGDVAPAVAARRYAAATMSMLVRKQFDEEGMHLEHSPQYHYWMCDELKSLLDSGWHDVDGFDSVYARALGVRPWLTYPDGRLVPVGDTITQFRYPTAIEAKQATVSTDSYLARAFAAGYAVCRSCPSDATDGSMLFLQAGYHSKAHKHSDHLHVELYDRGMPLLVDSGSTGYRGGVQRAYCLSTRAHNTVEFDGVNLERDGSHAYGSALTRLVAFERGVRFRAEVTHPDHAVRHVRTLEYEPGRRLRVTDELSAETDRDFVQWFHFAPGLDVVGPNEDGVHDVHVDGQVRWRARHLDTVDGIALLRGQEAPALQGWVAAGMDTLEPTWTIGYRKRGRQVKFRFEIVRAGPRWPSSSLGPEPLGVFRPPWRVAMPVA